MACVHPIGRMEARSPRRRSQFFLPQWKWCPVPISGKPCTSWRAFLGSFTPVTSALPPVSCLYHHFYRPVSHLRFSLCTIFFNTRIEFICKLFKQNIKSHFNLFFLNQRISLIFVVQSPSHVQLFEIPWTAACQALLSLTIFQNLPKFMFIESVMPSNYLILCCPLLLPSILSRVRVFSNELALCIRWPKYWSFSFNIIFPMNIQG